MAQLLLQPVNGVHHTLKFWPIEQIECTFFTRKHFQCYAACRGHHSRSLFRREIAFGDRFDRQLDEYSQAANPAAFVVDLLLCGTGTDFEFCSRYAACR